MNGSQCSLMRGTRTDRASAGRNYGDRAPRNADDPVFLVLHFNHPHVRGASDMRRYGCSAHSPFTLGPDVIGIDLESDGAGMLPIDIHDRSKRRERLGKCNGRATVKQAVCLSRAFVDWHRTDNARRRELENLDTELIGEPACCIGANRILRIV